MTRINSLTSLLFALLLFLSVSQDMFVSAQVGTVQSALFDYILNMRKTPSASSPQQPQTPAPPPSPPPPSATQPPALPAKISDVANTGPSMFDMYSQLMNRPQETTPSPSSSASSSAGGLSGSPSFQDMLNQLTSSSQVKPQPQPQKDSPPPLSIQPDASPSDPMSFYSQLLQVVSQTPPPQRPPPPPQTHTKHQVQPQPQTQPKPQPPPFFDPFPATKAPPPRPVQKPPPKVLPFVPPEWDLPKTKTHYGQTQGPSLNNGWGHGTSQRGYTGWEHQHTKYHTPHPQPVQRQPPAHPMSRMSMLPSFRNMVKKQATQFGDLPYYQQHGCVDPTPTQPGPGGIHPTQTLWYGCASPVSKMVCMRVGRRASKKPNTMAVMMSMMNPAMTRKLEKCLTPKMVTKMMLQGFSGGTGSMNPMMMMVMSGGEGGGGGEMAGMLPMMMTMMNRQNQQAQSPTPGLNLFRPAPPAFGPAFPPPSNSKQMHGDPSKANTLISQVARIPVGAAQPSPQSSNSSTMNAFSNVLGLGASQTPSAFSHSSLPRGAASTGAAPSSAARSQGLGLAPGEVDCSSLMPMMFAKMIAGGEGLNSPEAMEAIGEMRKQFLPYSCQELRIKYTGLPLRLCCPGRVEQPSIFDLFKAKNSAAGA